VWVLPEGSKNDNAVVTGFRCFATDTPFTNLPNPGLSAGWRARGRKPQPALRLAGATNIINHSIYAVNTTCDMVLPAHPVRSLEGFWLKTSIYLLNQRIESILASINGHYANHDKWAAAEIKRLGETVSHNALVVNELQAQIDNLTRAVRDLEDE
jgi:hypothetical protein